MQRGGWTEKSLEERAHSGHQHPAPASSVRACQPAACRGKSPPPLRGRSPTAAKHSRHGRTAGALLQLAFSTPISGPPPRPDHSHAARSSLPHILSVVPLHPRPRLAYNHQIPRLRSSSPQCIIDCAKSSSLHHGKSCRNADDLPRIVCSTTAHHTTPNTHHPLLRNCPRLSSSQLTAENNRHK